MANIGRGATRQRDAHAARLGTHPLGDGRYGGEALPRFGGGPGDLFYKDRRAHPAPIGIFVDGHIIVNQHRGNFESLLGGHLHRHLSIEHTTGIIFNDKKNAGTAIDFVRGGYILVGRGAGKDRARARCI